MTKWLILLLVWSASAAQAQQTFVGKLVDQETGEAVPFASIGIIGSSKGTSSNLEGQFSLICMEAASIKITCLGYESLVIDKLQNNLSIRLKSSTTQLKAVLITDKKLNGRNIVRKAFKSISKNYNKKAFTQKFFYRHYCKDDTLYGRLIEAGVDVWKRKGYRTQQETPGQREEVRVTQLRRSFDKTPVASGHVPIALNSILETDIVGYQKKVENNLFFIGEVSNLRHFMRQYTFTVEGITTYDGQDVYIIAFKVKRGEQELSTGIRFKFQKSGLLYINTKDYAFVKVQHERITAFDTLRHTAFYRKFEGKYYPYHLIKDGKNSFPIDRNGQRKNHWYHIELMSAEIQKNGYKKFKGREPTREMLLNIPFDSTFWNNYNILKATPLENDIVADLGGSLSLNKQFGAYTEVERKKILSGKEDEKRFNDFKVFAKGVKILYVDFWASWCGPCIQEMVYEKKLLEKYSDKIAFVLLSIDTDDVAWRNAIIKYKLARPGFVHYRIGNESDAALFYEVNQIPRYLLFDKAGEHFSLNAKRPSDPDLKNDFDFLIRQGNQ